MLAVSSPHAFVASLTELNPLDYGDENHTKADFNRITATSLTPTTRRPAGMDSSGRSLPANAASHVQYQTVQYQTTQYQNIVRRTSLPGRDYPEHNAPGGTQVVYVARPSGTPVSRHAAVRVGAGASRVVVGPSPTKYTIASSTEHGRYTMRTSSDVQRIVGPPVLVPVLPVRGESSQQQTVVMAIGENADERASRRFKELNELMMRQQSSIDTTTEISVVPQDEDLSRLRTSIATNFARNQPDLSDLSYFCHKGNLNTFVNVESADTMAKIPLMAPPTQLDRPYYPFGRDTMAYLKLSYRNDRNKCPKILKSIGRVMTKQAQNIVAIPEKTLMDYHYNGRHIHGYMIGISERADGPPSFLLDMVYGFLFPLYEPYDKWSLKSKIAFHKINNYLLMFFYFHQSPHKHIILSQRARQVKPGPKPRNRFDILTTPTTVYKPVARATDGPLPALQDMPKLTQQTTQSERKPKPAKQRGIKALGSGTFHDGQVAHKMMPTRVIGLKEKVAAAADAYARAQAAALAAGVPLTVELLTSMTDIPLDELRMLLQTNLADVDPTMQSGPLVPTSALDIFATVPSGPLLPAVPTATPTVTATPAANLAKKENPILASISAPTTSSTSAPKNMSATLPKNVSISHPPKNMPSTTTKNALTVPPKNLPAFALKNAPTSVPMQLLKKAPTSSSTQMSKKLSLSASMTTPKKIPMFASKPASKFGMKAAHQSSARNIRKTPPPEKERKGISAIHNRAEADVVITLDDEEPEPEPIVRCPPPDIPHWQHDYTSKVPPDAARRTQKPADNAFPRLFCDKPKGYYFPEGMRRRGIPNIELPEYRQQYTDSDITSEDDITGLAPSKPCSSSARRIPDDFMRQFDRLDVDTLLEDVGNIPKLSEFAQRRNKQLPAIVFDDNTKEKLLVYEQSPRQAGTSMQQHRVPPLDESPHPWSNPERRYPNMGTGRMGGKILVHPVNTLPQHLKTMVPANQNATNPEHDHAYMLCNNGELRRIPVSEVDKLANSQRAQEADMPSDIPDEYQYIYCPYEKKNGGRGFQKVKNFKEFYENSKRFNTPEYRASLKSKNHLRRQRKQNMNDLGDDEPTRAFVRTVRSNGKIIDEDITDLIYAKRQRSRANRDENGSSEDDGFSDDSESEEQRPTKVYIPKSKRKVKKQDGVGRPTKKFRGCLSKLKEAMREHDKIELEKRTKKYLPTLSSIVCEVAQNQHYWHFRNPGNGAPEEHNDNLKQWEDILEYEEPERKHEIPSSHRLHTKLVQRLAKINVKGAKKNYKKWVWPEIDEDVEQSIDEAIDDVLGKTKSGFIDVTNEFNVVTRVPVAVVVETKDDLKDFLDVAETLRSIVLETAVPDDEKIPKKRRNRYKPPPPEIRHSARLTKKAKAGQGEQGANEQNLEESSAEDDTADENGESSSEDLSPDESNERRDDTQQLINQMIASANRHKEIEAARIAKLRMAQVQANKVTTVRPESETSNKTIDVSPQSKFITPVKPIGTSTFREPKVIPRNIVSVKTPAKLEVKQTPVPAPAQPTVFTPVKPANASATLEKSPVVRKEAGRTSWREARKQDKTATTEVPWKCVPLDNILQFDNKEENKDKLIQLCKDLGVVPAELVSKVHELNREKKPLDLSTFKKRSEELAVATIINCLIINNGTIYLDMRNSTQVLHRYRRRPCKNYQFNTENNGGSAWMPATISAAIEAAGAAFTSAVTNMLPKVPTFQKIREQRERSVPQFSNPSNCGAPFPKDSTPTTKLPPKTSSSEIIPAISAPLITEEPTRRKQAASALTTMPVNNNGMSVASTSAQGTSRADQIPPTKPSVPESLAAMISSQVVTSAIDLVRKNLTQPSVKMSMNQTIGKEVVSSFAMESKLTTAVKTTSSAAFQAKPMLKEATSTAMETATTQKVDDDVIITAAFINTPSKEERTKLRIPIKQKSAVSATIQEPSKKDVPPNSVEKVSTTGIRNVLDSSSVILIPGPSTSGVSESNTTVVPASSGHLIPGPSTIADVQSSSSHVIMTPTTSTTTITGEASPPAAKRAKKASSPYDVTTAVSQMSIETPRRRKFPSRKNDTKSAKGSSKTKNSLPTAQDSIVTQTHINVTEASTSAIASAVDDARPSTSRLPSKSALLQKFDMQRQEAFERSKRLQKARETFVDLLEVVDELKNLFANRENGVQGNEAQLSEALRKRQEYLKTLELLVSQEPSLYQEVSEFLSEFDIPSSRKAGCIREPSIAPIGSVSPEHPRQATTSTSTSIDDEDITENKDQSEDDDQELMESRDSSTESEQLLETTPRASTSDERPVTEDLQTLSEASREATEGRRPALEDVQTAYEPTPAAEELQDEEDDQPSPSEEPQAVEEQLPAPKESLAESRTKEELQTIEEASTSEESPENETKLPASEEPQALAEKGSAAPEGPQDDLQSSDAEELRIVEDDESSEDPDAEQILSSALEAGSLQPITSEATDAAEELLSHREGTSAAENITLEGSAITYDDGEQQDDKAALEFTDEERELLRQQRILEEEQVLEECVSQSLNYGNFDNFESPSSFNFPPSASPPARYNSANFEQDSPHFPSPRPADPVEEVGGAVTAGTTEKGPFYEYEDVEKPARRETNSFMDLVSVEILLQNDDGGEVNEVVEHQNAAETSRKDVGDVDEEALGLMKHFKEYKSEYLEKVTLPDVIQSLSKRASAMSSRPDQADAHDIAFENTNTERRNVKEGEHKEGASTLEQSTCPGDVSTLPEKQTERTNPKIRRMCPGIDTEDESDNSEENAANDGRDENEEGDSAVVTDESSGDSNSESSRSRSTSTNKTSDDNEDEPQRSQQSSSMSGDEDLETGEKNLVAYRSLGPETMEEAVQAKSEKVAANEQVIFPIFVESKETISPGDDLPTARDEKIVQTQEQEQSPTTSDEAQTATREQNQAATGNFSTACPAPFSTPTTTPDVSPASSTFLTAPAPSPRTTSTSISTPALSPSPLPSESTLASAMTRASKSRAFSAPVPVNSKVSTLAQVTSTSTSSPCRSPALPTALALNSNPTTSQSNSAPAPGQVQEPEPLPELNVQQICQEQLTAAEPTLMTRIRTTEQQERVSLSESIVNVQQICQQQMAISETVASAPTFASTSVQTTRREKQDSFSQLHVDVQANSRQHGAFSELSEPVFERSAQGPSTLPLPEKPQQLWEEPSFSSSSNLPMNVNRSAPVSYQLVMSTPPCHQSQMTSCAFRSSSAGIDGQGVSNSMHTELQMTPPAVTTGSLHTTPTTPQGIPIENQMANLPYSRRHAEEYDQVRGVQNRYERGQISDCLPPLRSQTREAVMEQPALEQARFIEQKHVPTPQREQPREMPPPVPIQHQYPEGYGFQGNRDGSMPYEASQRMPLQDSPQQQHQGPMYPIGTSPMVPMRPTSAQYLAQYPGVPMGQQGQLNMNRQQQLYQMSQQPGYQMHHGAPGYHMPQMTPGQMAGARHDASHASRAMGFEHAMEQPQNQIQPQTPHGLVDPQQPSTSNATRPASRPLPSISLGHYNTPNPYLNQQRQFEMGSGVQYPREPQSFPRQQVSNPYENRMQVDQANQFARPQEGYMQMYSGRPTIQPVHDPYKTPTRPQPGYPGMENISRNSSRMSDSMDIESEMQRRRRMEEIALQGRHPMEAQMIQHQQMMQQQMMQQHMIRQMQSQSAQPHAMNPQAMQSQAMNQQLMNQQIMNSHMMNQQAMNQQAINMQMMNSRTIHQQTMLRQTMHQDTTNPQEIHQCSLALQQQAVRGQTMHQQTIHQQTMHQTTSSQMVQQTVHQQTIHHQTIHQQSMHQETNTQAMNQHAMPQQAMRDYGGPPPVYTTQATPYDANQTSQYLEQQEGAYRIPNVKDPFDCQDQLQQRQREQQNTSMDCGWLPEEGAGKVEPAAGPTDIPEMQPQYEPQSSKDNQDGDTMNVERPKSVVDEMALFDDSGSLLGGRETPPIHSTDCIEDDVNILDFENQFNKNIAVSQIGGKKQKQRENRSEDTKYRELVFNRSTLQTPVVELADDGYEQKTNAEKKALSKETTDECLQKVADILKRSRAPEEDSSEGNAKKPRSSEPVIGEVEASRTSADSEVRPVTTFKHYRSRSAHCPTRRLIKTRRRVVSCDDPNRLAVHCATKVERVKHRYGEIFLKSAERGFKPRKIAKVLNDGHRMFQWPPMFPPGWMAVSFQQMFRNEKPWFNTTVVGKGNPKKALSNYLTLCKGFGFYPLLQITGSPFENNLEDGYNTRSNQTITAAFDGLTEFDKHVNGLIAKATETCNAIEELRKKHSQGFLSRIFDAYKMKIEFNDVIFQNTVAIAARIMFNPFFMMDWADNVLSDHSKVVKDVEQELKIVANHIFDIQQLSEVIDLVLKVHKEKKEDTVPYSEYIVKSIIETIKEPSYMKTENERMHLNVKSDEHLLNYRTFDLLSVKRIDFYPDEKEIEEFVAKTDLMHFPTELVRAMLSHVDLTRNLPLEATVAALLLQAKHFFKKVRQCMYSSRQSIDQTFLAYLKHRMVSESMGVILSKDRFFERTDLRFSSHYSNGIIISSLAHRRKVINPKLLKDKIAQFYVDTIESPTPVWTGPQDFRTPVQIIPELLDGNMSVAAVLTKSPHGQQQRGEPAFVRIRKFLGDQTCMAQIGREIMEFTVKDSENTIYAQFHRSNWTPIHQPIAIRHTGRLPKMNRLLKKETYEDWQAFLKEEILPRVNQVYYRKHWLAELKVKQYMRERQAKENLQKCNDIVAMRIKSRIATSSRKAQSPGRARNFFELNMLLDFMKRTSEAAREEHQRIIRGSQAFRSVTRARALKRKHDTGMATFDEIMSGDLQTSPKRAKSVEPWHEQAFTPNYKIYWKLGEIRSFRQFLGQEGAMETSQAESRPSSRATIADANTFPPRMEIEDDPRLPGEMLATVERERGTASSNSSPPMSPRLFQEMSDFDSDDDRGTKKVEPIIIRPTY